MQSLQTIKVLIPSILIIFFNKIILLYFVDVTNIMLLKPCMYILFVNFENKEGEVVEIKIESLGG